MFVIQLTDKEFKVLEKVTNGISRELHLDEYYFTYSDKEIIKSIQERFEDMSNQRNE